jgi:hypothetical protein
VSELHRQQQNQQGSFEGNDENLPYVLFLLRGGSISNTSRLQS